MTPTGPSPTGSPAVRPTALRTGDVVAVVSPSSPVPRERLDAGVALLASWGLRPRVGAHARARLGHLAGSDAQRAADVNGALRDPRVRALWVARGGYGATRLLDRLDWDALARDPKPLVGFSDATALLVAAHRRSGVAGVHGQFAARLHLLDPAARRWLHDLLFGVAAGAALQGVPACAGTASGPLVGGNLAVLGALAGTADALRARGCVLLLEEVNESPYAVDRMLTQLLRSGALDGVRGVAVATPIGCAPPPTQPSATFDEVVAERLGGLGVPLVTGLPLGHVDRQRAVVHGGRVTLDGTRGVLVLTEGLARR